MCIYNANGTRDGVLAVLEEMRVYLDEGETELAALTDSTLEKLRGMEEEACIFRLLPPSFGHLHRPSGAILFTTSVLLLVCSSEQDSSMGKP